jgi:uncharacterized protein involved in outer membrane biogenesis
MKKILPVILIVTGVILILILGVYLAVRAYLTPANMRNLAQKLASETIKHPVQIGRVSLSFGWKIGVTIDDVQLPNPPGFPAEPMVKIEKVRLNLQLLPLLRHQIVISSIDLVGLEANLTKNRSNQLNAVLIIPKEAAGKDNAWKLSLSQIKLTKSTIKYVDETQKLAILVSDLNQTVDLRGSKITAVGEQSVFIPKSKGLPEMKLRIKNHVEYDTLKKNIGLRKISVTYEPLTLSATGTVTNLDQLDLSADLNIDDLARANVLIPEKSRPQKLGGSLKTTIAVGGTLKAPRLRGKAELKNVSATLAGATKPVENIQGTVDFDLNSITGMMLQGQVAGTKFSLNGSVTNLKSPIIDLAVQIAGNLKDLEGISAAIQGVTMSGPLSVSAAVKGPAANPSFSGDVSITNGQIDGIGFAKPMTNFRIKAGVQNNAIRIWECGGNIGKSDFNLSGNVANFKKPVVQIANSSNTIDLDEILPKPAPGKKAATGKPLPITLQGTVKVAKLNGMDMEFRNVNTNINFQNGIVDLKNCTADAFDGRVVLDFYYDANKPEPYRLISRMENLSTQKVFKRFLKFEAIEGRMNGVSNFQGNGFSQANVIANLSASGSLKLTNGAFNNFKFITMLLSWMGFANQNQLPINDLVCNFKIVNGKTEVNDWALASSFGNFLFNGTIGLTGSVNMNVTTTLTKEQSNKLKKYHAEWLLYYDAGGRATVDAVITGKLTDPKFSLDKKKIEERLKGKIKDEFDKKKKEIEDKLKDLFKKK